MPRNSTGARRAAREASIDDVTALRASLRSAHFASPHGRANCGNISVAATSRVQRACATTSAWWQPPSWQPSPRLSLLTMVKDAHKLLREWVPYHLLLGATHIYVVNNDCGEAALSYGGCDGLLALFGGYPPSVLHGYTTSTLERRASCLFSAISDGHGPSPHSRITERSAGVSSARAGRSDRSRSAPPVPPGQPHRPQRLAAIAQLGSGCPCPLQCSHGPSARPRRSAWLILALGEFGKVGDPSQHRRCAWPSCGG